MRQANREGPVVMFVRNALLMVFCVLLCTFVAPCGGAEPQGAPWTQWSYHPDGAMKIADVRLEGSGWSPLKTGERFKARGEGAWLKAEVVIPEHIGGIAAQGKPIGLRINSDSGGEIYVQGALQMRYDNDHAGMALLTRSAAPGTKVLVAVRAFRSLGDENQDQSLGEAVLVLLDPARVNKPANVRIHLSKKTGDFRRSFAGMSQGWGMADYNDDTAARFRDIRIEWFRMDNIFTDAVKRGTSGELVFDWTGLDRRLDFMKKIDCEFIACVSYMPEALEAFPNKDRHARPASYAEWEELCYRAARHCLDTGRGVRYWEVWNESNSGWLAVKDGEDRLQEYLKLYDATWRGVRRADPKALIGGPCNASGPWNQSPERGYATHGEEFMRGLLDHCERTGAPLDFISWHEYFHPPDIIREEAEVTRAYMKDYPKAARGVREFMITEWNYAWWPDWPQDHELGACWAANSVLRAMIPARIDKPCFFFAKDGDDNFRGGWGMLMGPNNRPKAVYNAAKLFSMMAPKQVRTDFTDPEVAVVATTDPATGRTTVLVLNYAERYGVERRLMFTMSNLDRRLKGGTLRRWVVDRQHSNAFHNKDRAELESIHTGRLSSSTRFSGQITVPTNSLTLLEFLPGAR